ncbi:MAG TPA: hypothetical protein VGH27_08135 [Streptosporangiaceae bacterium]
MDPTVAPRFTEYYNHSIAPDIVLRWPGENNRERLLYVRPTANASWLLHELPFIRSHRPLVFTLEDLDGDSRPEKIASPDRVLLEEQATTAGTWITDPSGTEAVSTVRNQSHVAGMLSRALVRGGRGVSDGREIHDLTDTAEGGFDAASRGSILETRSAVEAIETHLDTEQSGRLTRLLRAIWEGYGSDSARFPSTLSLGKLTADDLSYLLTITSQGSAEFWRRIGRTVTTELLGRIHVEDPSQNLQALISASLEALQAKGIRLITEPVRLDEEEYFPRWTVSRGCLALRGLNWTTYIAARLNDELPPADDADMPNLRTLRERAAAHYVRITEVQLAKADRAVTYGSTEGGEILRDDALSRIEADLNGALVDKVDAVLPEGGKVEVDFPRRTALGKTSATFLLGPLMRTTLPLLSDFTPSELAELRPVIRGDGYQEDLFSGDEQI